MVAEDLLGTLVDSDWAPEPLKLEDLLCEASFCHQDECLVFAELHETPNAYLYHFQAPWGNLSLNDHCEALLPTPVFLCFQLVLERFLVSKPSRFRHLAPDFYPALLEKRKRHALYPEEVQVQLCWLA